MMNRFSGYFLFLSTLFLCVGFPWEPLTAQAIPVELRQDSIGQWSLYRNGEKYWIEGAGTSNMARFRELAIRGGNSLRTWGVDDNTGALLDTAYQYGLTVTLGLWVGRETDGFNYDNQSAVAAQLSKFTQLVLQHKDHPALLAWGIGNEVNIGYSNLKVWDAIDDLSRMIHELDGNHPTLTVTAGISLNLAQTIASRAPDLDMLGVNAYGGIGGVDAILQSSGWAKPYILTEWGVNGPWETSKTNWNAPIEPNSSQKAQTFQDRYQQYILPHKGKILGSYVFLWNEKFEGTYTWFGLFVNESTTRMVDAMQYVWTDTLSRDLAPEIHSIRFRDLGEKTNYTLLHAKNNVLEVVASDPENEPLTYEFIIRPESGNTGVVTIPMATYQGLPGIIDHSSGPDAVLNFNASEDKNYYRIYILVRDPAGHVATASLPIRTLLIDLKVEYTFNPEQDAYVQSGDSSTITHGQNDPYQLLSGINTDSGEPTESYLLFDLNQAPAVYTRVELQLYGDIPSMSRWELLGFEGHYWFEKWLSWNNKFSPGSGVLSLSNRVNDPEGSISWDITEFIFEQFSNQKKQISFVVRGGAESGGQCARFSSKESMINPPKVTFFTGTNTNEIQPVADCLVYPNPVQDHLFIDPALKLGAKPEIRILTLAGPNLYSGRLLESGRAIGVAHLPPGIYWIHLRDPASQMECRSVFVKG